jgi:K+-transporting ATPase KdpF subunit
LPGFRRGVREVLSMWEIIVGIIGLALILYLFMAIVHPEKF